MLFLVVLTPLAAAWMPPQMQADAGTAGDAPDDSLRPRFLSSPGIFDGELSYPLDFADMYALRLDAGEHVWIGLGSLDFATFEVIAPNGSIVKSGSSIGPLAQGQPVTASTRRWETVIEASGTWLVRVRTSQTGSLDYRLAWEKVAPVDAAPVVVATFDTGTNPFHPCWVRPGYDPRIRIPGYPSSRPLQLTRGADFGSSVASSAQEIAAIEDWTLYHVVDTNLAFFGGDDAASQLVDRTPHGAQASSQIGCEEYGLAPNAQLVIVNYYNASGTTERRQLMRWVAEQPWIDIVHLNIQDLPVPSPGDAWPEFREIMDSGKLLVIAAGNGVAGQGVPYPMEASRWNGPPGSLIAGANSNDGWQAYTNLNPHVVMDGGGTFAAAGDSFGTTIFGGTSSASPRVAGYAARLLGELRMDLNATRGSGLLDLPEAKRPSIGPLADGILTSADLHETIRKTADPRLHPSRFDGDENVFWVPAPAPAEAAVYTKNGYGEVSEFTLAWAKAVLAGNAPMPSRTEDRDYGMSEGIRTTVW